MSKLEMNSRLLTWIRLMIGHFLEGWAFFTRKFESVMSVKVCPWWVEFNMRSVTCYWLRYSVHRKIWNRRLEQVWTLDFLCLRLSNFCLFSSLRWTSSWILKLTRSRIWFKCTWDSHLTCALGGERTRGEDGRMVRDVLMFMHVWITIANQFLQL